MVTYIWGMVCVCVYVKHVKYLFQPSGLGNANAMHTDEEKTLLIDGTESLMLLEFCAKHNCTLEISLGWLHNYYYKLNVSFLCVCMCFVHPALQIFHTLHHVCLYIMCHYSILILVMCLCFLLFPVC